LELAARHPGPILELGCGTGRVLLPLAHAGHHVHGLDNDPEMLAFLENQISQEISATTAVALSDFTRFKIDKRFSLAIMPCNTYSTLSEEQRRSTLACIQEHLLPTGCFAASLPNPVFLASLPESAEAEVEDAFNHPIDHEPVQVSSAWKRSEQHFLIEWHYDHLLPDGTVDRLSAKTKHTLTAVETYVEEILDAGFEYLLKFGDFDYSRYTRPSPHLIITAWKDKNAATSIGAVEKD